MPLFNKQELRGTLTFNESILKSASIRAEDRAKPLSQKFKIFLSHSYSDREFIPKLRETIQNMGFTTYVDWIDDNDLNRSDVSKETAERLRQRMKNCECLFFVTSANSPNSKWMPWECGYFDALKGNVAICPITEKPETGDSYNGQEYLGLYYYVVNGSKLWIHEADKKYTSLENWLNGSKPTLH